KRKESLDSTSSHTAGDLPVVGQRGMAELPEGAAPPEDHQNWRAFYEHPLTAATTAMLNIGGGAEDQSTAMGLIYEYYKIPDSKDKLADIWSAGSQAGGILTSQLKATNGLVSGAGLELATPPLSAAGQLNSQELQGLFINPHVGYTQPAAAGQNLQIVKREPEDLSHHRKLDCSSPSSGSIDGSIIIPKLSRPKVVLVSSAVGQSGDLVVDVNSIKDESHHGLTSPQHGSRSINGTPTSTHSSLLADSSSTGPIEFISANGLKPAMYTTQIFASMSSAPHSGGSGTPSPIPYTDHVQYSTQSSLAGGSVSGNTTIYSSTGRPSSSTTFSATDPYYREYFTVASGAGTPEPLYSTQLRNNQLAYADEAATGGTTASFVERYVRQSTYHGKGVIAAAGLTVDLPSPDSGIGADAITPRDQNTLQQSFDYAELCQTNSSLLDPLSLSQRSNSSAQSPGNQTTSRSRPWHDFGRQNDADKIQIPKIFSPVGFKYHLETPISTSQRREDDRITYINKGQFYGITLEYLPDPDKQLKSQTVKQKEYRKKMEELKLINEKALQHINQLRNELKISNETIQKLEREGRRENIVIQGLQIDTDQPLLVGNEVEKFIEKEIRVKVNVNEARKLGEIIFGKDG
uniref:Protein grainyhead-like n=1 Tax=Diabrotica virgifera virgifera TaxID=50390 RepID=A0A6P7GHK1_DIAVI